MYKKIFFRMMVLFAVCSSLAICFFIENEKVIASIFVAAAIVVLALKFIVDYMAEILQKQKP